MEDNLVDGLGLLELPLSPPCDDDDTADSAGELAAGDHDDAAANLADDLAPLEPPEENQMDLAD